MISRDDIYARPVTETETFTILSDGERYRMDRFGRTHTLSQLEAIELHLECIECWHEISQVDPGRLLKWAPKCEHYDAYQARAVNPAAVLSDEEVEL